MKKENKANGGRPFKHSFCRIFFPLLVLLCLSVNALPALAEPASPLSPTVFLSAAVRITGESPAGPEVYTVRLTAIDRALLPDGSRDFLDLTLAGPGTVVFPALVYPTVGIYRYTVTQITGSDPAAAYDESVYQVTVTVTNSEPEGSLKATIVLMKNGEKQDAMEFVNEYGDGPLWGDDNPPPDVPEDPPADEIPEIPPVDEPPEGTVPPSDGSLIQTGQHRLPVLLLAFAGAILTAFGVVLLCKNEKSSRGSKERGSK